MKKEEKIKFKISDIEKIIEIKKKIIKNKKDENIFEQIHELYNKLIEISSNKEGEDFSKYVKDFQNFLGSYDKSMKNNIKQEPIQQNKKYNFGFD